MNTDIPAEVALRKYLESSDLSGEPMQHRAKTAECLSLHLLKKHLERNIRLADEQLEHIAGCAGFCQKNLDYLRKYGALPIAPLAERVHHSLDELVATSRDHLNQLSGEVKSFGESIRSGLLCIFTVHSLAAGAAQHSYPVLVEDMPGQYDCIVTQGPWISEGRLIMRLTFRVPNSLRQKRPIELLFVGVGGKIFRSLELAALNEQLVNVQLPSSLPDCTLRPEFPLPCGLVLRLGAS